MGPEVLDRLIRVMSQHEPYLPHRPIRSGLGVLADEEYRSSWPAVERCPSSGLSRRCDPAQQHGQPQRKR
jgi:hypothetical protein